MGTPFQQVALCKNQLNCIECFIFLAWSTQHGEGSSNTDMPNPKIIGIGGLEKVEMKLRHQHPFGHCPINTA